MTKTALLPTAIFTETGFILENADYGESRYNYLYQLGFTSGIMECEPAFAFLHDISTIFIKSLSLDTDIEITRHAKPLDLETAYTIFRTVPFALGVEYISIQWIQEQWSRLADVFNAEIDEYDGSVADYFKSKNDTLNVVGRVFFHLVESKDEDFPFAFLATYSTGDRDNLSHLPLKNALVEFKDKQDALLGLLAAVSKASDRSDFISELVENGELFSPLRFDPKEAYTILSEIPLYEECGIVCRIPDFWKQKSNKVRVSLSIGGKKPSHIGMDALMSFDPSIYLGDTEMTEAEIHELLSQSAGLSFIKGKWVEVNHDKLRAALDAFGKAENMQDMTFAEAMRMQLNISQTFGEDTSTEIQVTNGQWLNEIKSKMLNPAEIKDIKTGKDFLTTLRHYQQSGLNWLFMMQNMGFGALLADDMGLGKTVQILALLEHQRKNKKLGKILLVIPASLLCNWKNEADKFAPKLQYEVIHGNNTGIDLDDADLFITTYGMVQRLEEIKSVEWDLVILDEAQAIKNSGTKQTKAIKELTASAKIAMTGTPIENKLSDLWSIFDFLNQGMLGTAKEFGDFAKALKNDLAGYARLREIVQPFILRRLKTDKSVIADLPDKIEVRQFTALTKKQIILYKALVAELETAFADDADELTVMKRRGLVLASIMKFKQICNHPDQYLGQKAFKAVHSGKFERLSDICETIFEKRERVLIFTQFKEMTQPIADFLEETFGRAGLVLHGGTQVKKRGELVEKFNGEDYMPFMVLSVKAGGVGLNLTAANHVIHFDRWWNPAIENQATDRAFRIGQSKNVTVHKFVTSGTIEDKIDTMLAEKQKMADDIIADSGEKWVTELNNNELMSLFRLEVKKFETN
ncbi:MAG: DEAD/DEAH box helicase [Oscillospiraceae bacterium]|jgi:non-specific serine/threonine protein kinase|nr:DEAD/DEAH box helicase [Oscillospiraceae bacterium]